MAGGGLEGGGTNEGIRAGFAVALWVALILGLILGLWPRAPVPRPALLAGLLLGGVAALSGLSLAWAVDDSRAFVETIRALVHLGLFVAVVLASSPGSSRRWIGGLALGLACVAAIALVGRTQPGLIATAEALRGELQPARLRLSYPIGYWNGLGVAMALAALMLLWLSVEARSPRARAAALAALPAVALTLYLTGSRGPILAVAIGLVTLIALAPRRGAVAGSLAVGGLGGATLIAFAVLAAPDITGGLLFQPGSNEQGDLLLGAALLVCACVGLARYGAESLRAPARPPRRVVRPIAAAAAAAVVLGLVLAGPASLVEASADRAGSVCAPTGTPSETIADSFARTGASGRCEFWEVGLDAFASAPAVGIGAGGWQAWWAQNHTIPFPTPFAHSIVVASLAELGIVGLLLVVGFFGVAVVAGIRARRRPESRPAVAIALAIVAAGGFAATIDWMWELPAVSAIIIVACALLTGPALAPPPAGGRGRFGFGVAVLLAGWAAIVAAGISFLGQDRIDASRTALAAGDLDRSVERAEAASTVLPWSQEPYVLKAAALEGDGDLDGAEDSIGEAIDRAPFDPDVWAVAARIYAGAGNDRAASDAFERAAMLAPSIEAGPSRG